MKNLHGSCDLCGLPARSGITSSDSNGEDRIFCCVGCKQVFTMLMDAPGMADADIKSLKDTELFKRCKEIGIIPASEIDLEQRVKSENVLASSHSTISDPKIMGNTKGVAGREALSLRLRVNNMWCPACAWVIEEAVKKEAGIINATCSFSTDRLWCEYNPVLTSPAQIIRSIAGWGYNASMPGEEDQSLEKRRESVQFIVSAFLTMNVMMLSFSLYSGFLIDLSQEAVYKLSLPIAVMASIVLFYGGRQIYQRAWVGISSVAFSMETLITAGSFSAYIYSTINLLIGSFHLYYDTASLLITIVLLGKLLERKAKDKIQEDLDNLFSIQPTKVRICSESYPKGRYVSAKSLEKGSLFMVEDGEIVPADGEIIEGNGSVDESSLTGEAMPIKKRSRDKVMSGSRVTHGFFRVRAEAVGKDSMLGQMILIMERALVRKTPLEGKTDHILQWFVPIILILSLGTGLTCLLYGVSFDYSLIRAVTVVVIACPCTLGIAVPLARVAGISMAGRIGILVRDFSSFEQADRIRHFVFDKTGTVTQGEWKLLNIIPLGPFTEEQILALAVSLERGSDHYIAMEIKMRAEKDMVRPVKLEKVRAFENGITGRDRSNEIKIGSKAFLEKEIVAAGPFTVHDPSENAPAQSHIYMSYSGKLCAVFVFGDRIRDGASATVKALHGMGRGVALVSGDGDGTTKEIGRRLGIEESHGGMLPQDKAAFIEERRRRVGGVAMVGDGINDAPALLQSDLAIAVHSGSHLGREAADITLMKDNPIQVLDFLSLAKKVNRKVSQNLGFSFVYNIVSIPVAMSGLLTPLIAVSAMLLSSLSVIGNTLYLIKKS